MKEKHQGALTGHMEVRLWLRLLSCSTIIEKRLRRRFVTEFETTLPRFDVMAALDRRPEGVSMGELSRDLLVSNGNLTALVRQIEKSGQLTLNVDPSDRRTQIVCLTEAGRENFARQASAHHSWIRSMFGGMSRDDQQALYKLLDELKSSIGSARG